MGIRSLLHHIPEQPRSQTLPDLNRDIVNQLETGVGDVLVARDGIRREIHAMERRPPTNLVDRQAWEECLRIMREFELEADEVVKKAENELKDAKMFESAVSKSQADTCATLWSTARQPVLNPSSPPADSNGLNGPHALPTKEPVEKTLDIIENRPEPSTMRSRRDSVANLVNVTDARRFLHDPEFQEEYADVRRAFRPANANKSVFLIGNLGLDSSAARGSLIIRRVDISEQVKQSPGLANYLSHNSAFKTYPVTETRQVRQSLPALRDTTARINYWRIVKENIGNSLPGLVLPMYMREPLTFNQKAAEMFEYSHVLRAANRNPSEESRIAGVAAFFLICLGQGKGRTGLPFSPLLGETFDLVQDDFRLLVETVSVVPQAQAVYAECDDFVVTGLIQPSLSISISSIVIDAQGEYEVLLKATGERYLVRTPSLALTDFVFGDLSFWVKGELTIGLVGSKRTAVVRFKPKGWSNKTDCGFVGVVTNDRGETVGNLCGRWDEAITFQGPKTEKPMTLAILSSLPSSAASQYNFTFFVANLNHLPTDLALKIPLTDSRWRSDVRAYEFGNMEMATLENFRIEDLHELNGKDLSSPRWFRPVVEGPRGRYVYKGGYFESRENGRWPQEVKLPFD